MSHRNVHGKCALCLASAKLCRSHYLGRVLHSLSSVNREHPVVMTPDLVTSTPRQVWAHLLCSDCERLLNDTGEKPVQALFNDKHDNFPLLNRMELALPMKFRSSFKLSLGGLLCPDVDGTLASSYVPYSGAGMGINTEALAYYALSVLWKGSAHSWKTLQGQESTVAIGKYQEAIRCYLRAEAGFPDGVYVIATVCTDKGSQGMVFAPSLVADSRFPMYSLLVRGLWFHVITTDNAPGLSELCCYRSAKRVLFKEDCGQRFLEAASHIHKTAKIEV